MKILGAILTILLSTQAYGSGMSRLICESENTNIAFFFISNTSEGENRRVEVGSIDFFGSPFSINPNSEYYSYHSLMDKEVLEDGTVRFNYNRFGGYQLLFETDYYKYRLSVYEDKYEVYAVSRKVPILDEDLVEIGACTMNPLF